MGAFKLHHRIPGLKKPFLQRNEARAQRDRALEAKAQAIAERDEAVLVSEMAQRRLEEAEERIRVLEEIGRANDERPPNLFVPPGHFYSPIVDPEEADAHIARLEQSPTPRDLPGIRIDAAAMERTWMRFLPRLKTHPFTAEKEEGLRYAFINDQFSWGDGLILHSMLRLYQPERIVEVGSGWSSACMVDTIERYFETPCDLTFIEPYPERLRLLVGNATLKHRFYESKIQDAPPTLFEQLGENDLLFIDSTHVLRTGSDVCHELFEILPSLRPGVIVHFHDIFWPFEYPRQWAVSDNRSWNEIYAIRAFLMDNDNWRILFFNHYFGLTHTQLIQATFPDFLRNCGGSLWLQKC